VKLSTSSRRVATLVAALALVSVLAVASGVLGRVAPAAPAPSAKPTPTAPASPTPSSKPSSAPSAAPSAPSAPAGVFSVDLKNETDHDVKLEIKDASGSVVGASSGTPGDGMTVRWFDSKVENVDADTLRIIFVGLPRDEVVRLAVSEKAGKLHFDFVQDAPPAQSDAVGFDRILVIDFDHAVSADATVVTFTD
jgi:hypothetical protein